MDSRTAKTILSSYRSDSEGADDPVYQAALRRCREDPELTEWLEEERARDKQMEEALGSITPPPEGIERLLAFAYPDGAGLPSHPRSKRIAGRWWRIAAVAAILPLGAIVWQSLTPPDNATQPVPAALALTDVSNRLSSLDYTSNSVSDVNNWLRSRGAPNGEDLPASFLAARSRGCAVVDDGRGRAVSMICLKLDGGLVHVFVMDRDSPLAHGLPKGEWTRDLDTNVYAWTSEGTTFAITTEIEPAKVDSELLGTRLHRAS